MAAMRDLKSLGQKCPCEFESHWGYKTFFLFFNFIFCIFAEKESEMKKKLTVFNVLRWGSYQDTIEHYDVLPSFRNALEARKKEWKKNQKSKRFQKYLEDGLIDLKYYKYPETKEELKEFILDTSLYLYWAKCEHEIIIHAWPVRKNDYKMDVHEQVKMNIDVITDLLYDEYFEK